MFNKKVVNFLMLSCVYVCLMGHAVASTTTTVKTETSVKVKTVSSALSKKAKWANDNSPVPNLMPLVSEYAQKLKLTKNQITAFKALTKTENTQTKNLLVQFGKDNALLRGELLKQSFTGSYKKKLEHYKVNVLLDMASILNMDIKQSGFIRANLNAKQWSQLTKMYLSTAH